MTVRDPPTEGEERRGVEVGRKGEGEEGTSVDVAVGEVCGLPTSTAVAAAIVELVWPVSVVRAQEAGFHTEFLPRGLDFLENST